MPDIYDLAAQQLAEQQQAPLRNEYDAPVQQLAEAEQLRLRASISEALRRSPDEYARTQQLAKRTGLPAPVVERNIDEVDRRVKLNEYDRILAASPLLREYMAREDFAALAHDDLDVLERIDMYWRALKSSLVGFGGTAPNAFLEALTRAVSQNVTDPLARAGVLPEDPLREAADYFTRQREYGQAWQQRIAGDRPTNLSSTEQAILSGIESAGMNFAALGAGLVARNPQLALWLMSLGAGSLKYGDAVAAGKDPNLAFHAAVGEAGFELLTEMLPVSVLFKDLERGAPFYKIILNQLVQEIPQEQAATLLQDINDWMVLNPDKTLVEFLRERPEAAYQTLVATIVGSGIQTGAITVADRTLARFTGDDIRRRRAQEELQRLTRLMQLAGESKLRARAPDSFAEFVQRAAEEVGDVTEVYVDARVFGEVLNQAGISPEDVSPEVARQFREAAPIGGDIRIPVGEFAARIAPEAYGQELLQHLRTSPEDMSAAEAAQFEQEAAAQFREEAEKALAQQEDNEAFQTEAQQVEEILLGELARANRFTPDVNSAYAAMVRDFYVTLADRLGVTPLQLYERYPLRVVASQVADPLEQLPPEQIEVDRSAQDIGEFVITGRDAEGNEIAHMQVEDRGDVLQIRLAAVNESRRGEGIGQQLIQEAWKLAQEEGKPLVSDRAVSRMQLHVYEALKRKGWTIEYTPTVYQAGEPTTVEAALRSRGDLGVTAYGPVVTRIEPPAAERQQLRHGRAQAALAEDAPPAPPEGFIRFRHFGNVRTPVLDPSFMGTGMRGEERFRDPVRSISLYPDTGFTRESGVGPIEYVVDVPAQRLYDASQDPLGFAEEAQVPVSYTMDPETGEMVPASTRFDMDTFERLVRDAGFIGYFTPGAEGNLRGQARIFEPIEVAGVDENEAERLVAEAPGVFYQSPIDEVQGFATIKPHLTEQERAQLRRDTAARLVEMFRRLPKDIDFADAAVAGAAKRGWYANAVRTLRQVFGEVDAPRFAALMAALSPQIDVETNLRHAVQTWVNWNEAGRPTDPEEINAILDRSVTGRPLDAWRNNTVRALSTPVATDIVLSGPKVDSFMRNLAGNAIEVTNDTWMANFALVDQTIFKGNLRKSGPGKGPGYLAMNAKIRRVAKRLTRETGQEWTPAEVQETVWSWAKTAVELADAAGETRSVEELVLAGEITDERITSTPDFATMLAEDATIREILEAAGYGEAIRAIEIEFGGSAVGESAGAAAVTPALLRSARRLDALRQQRAAAESETRERGRAEREAASRPDVREPGTPLAGLPDSSPGPLAAIQQLATDYVEANRERLGITLPPHTRYVKVDPERAARFAQAYDEAVHDPNDPEVQAAYRALIDETLAQYQEVKKLGLKIEFIQPGQPDPYPEGPKQVFEDIRNGHLWVFPTDQGFGTLNETFEHPLLELTDEYVGEHRLVANDVFRIVHDVFGHAKEGNGFGPIGEENAWHSHVRMYSPLAARAMTTETRGQNSWVNYGPFGEQNRANQRETIYADQKAALLPEWVSTLGIEEGHEQVADIGEAAPASDEQFAAADDLPPQFVMVSAERAGLSPEENARRTEQLEQDLREAGFEPQRARGMYQGVPEASFLVPVADATELAEVLQLGLEKYEQESVLVVDEERRARLEFLDDFPMELGRFNPIESTEGLEAFTEIPEGGGRFFAALPAEQEAETFEQGPISDLQVVEREELGGGFLLEADGGNTALMRVYKRDGFFQIAGAEVAESVRGRGAGQQLIRRAYAEAKRRGGPLVSDTEVTVAQLRAYEGLKRRGWTIEYADPDAVAEALKTNDPELEVESDGPVVTRIEPPAALEQEARGQISSLVSQGGGATIALLRTADLSTFLHESGHFFLEVYADLASRPDTPQQIRDDFDALLKWFGVESVEAWNAMSLEQKRPHHEKFARGFEAYLFEGKAPTTELQSLFQRFRAWLLNVYRSLTALKVELTDEVRAVMGRMLAADQAIAATEQARQFTPLFESAEDAGMTPEEWERYQETHLAAREAASDELQRRSLRDMQWASHARSRVLKQLQRDAMAKRKAIRAEVADEVAREPIYRVIRWLSRGEMTTPDGEEIKAEKGYKLDVAALEEMYPPGELAEHPDWQKLRPRFASSTGTQHPDTIAELFGFRSGDHLVRALLEAEPMDDVIEALTDRRMLERYGDITDARALERAADEAVHNDARARFVATEIRALTRAVEGRGVRGGFNVMMKAAREFARQTIARRKIRSLSPAQFAAAQTRAARAADRALAKGDRVQAAAEKRNQLVNLLAVRAAYDAQAEVERGVRYLKKFERDAVRAKLAPDYLEQIDAILERFDLRKGVTGREAERRKSLLEWVEAQREEGFDPDIPPEILAEARRMPYRELTVEEFRGLVDSVKQIEHLARLKNKLLTAKRQREFDAAVAEAAQTIEENARRTLPDELEAPKTKLQFIVKGTKEFFAMHRKLASVARQMDGFKDGGTIWELFVRPLNEAGDREAAMRAEATRELDKIFSPLLKRRKLHHKVDIPEIGRSLSWEGILSIALNWGNETNRKRVMEGDKWTPEQVQAILSKLTKEDWDFVQQVWDFIDSYWPQIADKQRRVYGIAPEKVEAAPVETPFGTYRGGYYPIAYDPQRSSKSAADTDAEAIRQALQGAYTRATTRRGHTKQRVDSVQRPMRKDFGVLFQHANNVIHDLTHHEALIDVQRLLRAPAIDQAIRRHYGPQFVDLMRRAFDDIARGDQPAQNVFERSINHLRVGATVVGLGWNLSTAMLQPLGLTQSVVRIGPQWVARGFSRWLGSPQRMNETVEWMYEKSEFMKGRAATMQREINEIQNRVAGKKLTDVQQSFFWLIQKMQLVADIPTWLGAYEKAMAEGRDEATAIALADQAVIDSQGGGQVKDLAAIQRGGPLMKLWTNFYSYFNTLYNLLAESVHRTDLKSPKSIGRLAVDFVLLVSVPAVLSEVIRQALGAGGDDDELAERLLRLHASYLLGTMIVLRDMGGVIEGYEYKGPGGLRGLDEMARLIQQADQREVDAAFLRALNNAAGIFIHYPAGQVERTVTGIKALLDGETENPGALVVGHRED